MKTALKADLRKLSSSMEPGQFVCTLNGSYYRVASKVATADGYVFRLADLQGKPVQTPADFHPVSPALARTAAWMRFVFAYNKDFDLYVKEYIKDAGLPVDPKMHWDKWFQYAYPPKLSGLTQDPDVIDEAIHQVIITALAKRKDLTKFDASRLPEGARKQPLAEQVTTYLQWLFKKRISEAYEFIKEKIFPPEEISMWQENPEGPQGGHSGLGGEEQYNVLDTEEHATPGGQAGIEEQTDLTRLRDGFASWLKDNETPNEITKLLVCYDFFVQNTGRTLKISDYAPYFKEQTDLGFDSLKPVYAKFKRYIPEFLVETGMISKEKAMARGMSATSSLKPRLASLNVASAEWDPAESAIVAGPTSDEQIIPNQSAEAGPATEELNENSHPENGPAGSPVLDGDLKSPERPNVNAVREALDAQVEMEVGKPIIEKQEELRAEENAPIEVESGKGKQIIINIAAGPVCECGHGKTYHDSKGKQCHGSKDCPCNGNFRKAKTAGNPYDAVLAAHGFEVDPLDPEDQASLKEEYPQFIASYSHPDDKYVILEVPDAWHLVGSVANDAGWHGVSAEDLDRHLNQLGIVPETNKSAGEEDAVERTGDKEVEFNPKRGSFGGLKIAAPWDNDIKNPGEPGCSLSAEEFYDLPDLRDVWGEYMGIPNPKRHKGSKIASVLDDAFAEREEGPYPDCPECGHPTSLHKPPYGCEQDLGDRPGDESGPAEARGECGCKYGMPKTGASCLHTKNGEWCGRCDLLSKEASEYPGISMTYCPKCRKETRHAVAELATGKAKQCMDCHYEEKLAADDTGRMPHNPEAGSGRTGPADPIVVDTKVAAPPAPPAPRPAGPAVKQYGTPIGEKGKPDVDVIPGQEEDSGSGYQEQPRRKTIMPELPNAEMILQLNASEGKGKIAYTPSFHSQIPGDDSDFDVVKREDQADEILEDLLDTNLPKGKCPWVVTYADMSVHADVGLKYFMDEASAQAWVDGFNEMMEADPEEGAIVMSRKDAVDWVRGMVGNKPGLQRESSQKTAKINKDIWKRLQDAFPGDGDLAFSPKYQEYIVKHGYFYSHGYDEDKLAVAVKKVIPEAQVTKATNHWNAWPKDSWFEVRFKVPEAMAPIAPAPAPATSEPKVEEPPMATPATASVTPEKRAALREKIAARRKERAEAKNVKYARLQKVAADEPEAADEGLMQLGDAFGQLAEDVEALRENLDLVEAPAEAPLEERIASRRAYAKKFRQIATENPEQLEMALAEVYQSLDEVAQAVENYADHMGLDVQMASPVPEEAPVVEETPASEIPAEDASHEGVSEEHPEVKEAAKPGAVKPTMVKVVNTQEVEMETGQTPQELLEEVLSGELMFRDPGEYQIQDMAGQVLAAEGSKVGSTGADAFSSDRDHDGKPKEATSGSDNFVTDRDDKGDAKMPQRVEVPRLAARAAQIAKDAMAVVASFKK